MNNSKIFNYLPNVNQIITVEKIGQTGQTRTLYGKKRNSATVLLSQKN
jgi:hypothetical protein